MLSLHLLPSAECVMKACKKNLDLIATGVLQNICLMRMSMLQQVVSINQSINQPVTIMGPIVLLVTNTLYDRIE